MDASPGRSPRRSPLRVEIKEDHATGPGVINHLKTTDRGNHETLTDLDFLKEDMYASPRFAIDPK